MESEGELFQAQKVLEIKKQTDQDPELLLHGSSSAEKTFLFIVCHRETPNRRVIPRNIRNT